PLATRAFNGSLKDLEELQSHVWDLCAKEPIPRHTIRFLPAFYNNLASDDIPTPETFNTRMPDRPPILDVPVLRTARLRTSMRGIAAYTHFQVLPLDCIAELWQRLWPCIAFQNFYSRILAKSFAYLDRDADDDDFDNKDIDIEENYMSQIHLTVIVGIACCRAPADNALEPCVAETAGIRYVLAKIWSHVVRDARTRRICTEHLGYAIAHMLDFDVPEYREEIVQGVGGTEFDVGRLIVDHIAGITVDVADEEPTHSQQRSVLHGLNFLQICREEGRSYIVPHGALKVVTRLATALQPWINNHSKDKTLPSYFLIVCVTFLYENLRWQPGIDGVIGALAGGLLPLIARQSAPIDDSPHPHDCAQRFLDWFFDMLRTVLPGYLCHYTVLNRMQKSLERMRAMGLVFHPRSPLLLKWTHFLDLAHERIKIKTEFDTEHVPLKFCDNLTCHQVAERTEFRRCSRCRSVSYCSKTCQETDWITHHRRICESPVPDTISPRLLAFMRHLVHHDYLRLKTTAYFYRLYYLFQGAGGPCYITFNYTSGRVALRFEPIDKWPPVEVSSRSYEVNYPWKEIVERAEDAKGELNLDVMLFPDGMGNNYRVFPMRCSSPMFHARMKELNEQRLRGKVSEGEGLHLIRALADGSRGTITELHL
ncbi:hypothetical protein R3P38DRAFT_2951019, partial [Favolaschia claudopus]